MNVGAVALNPPGSAAVSALSVSKDQNVIEDDLSERVRSEDWEQTRALSRKRET